MPNLLRGRVRMLATAALLVGLLTACVGDAGLPPTCHDPSVSLMATLSDEHLEPATLEACRGQSVTITFTIERDGVLHLHGYDDQLSATEVRAGQKAVFAFEAVRSGQFPIALHTTDGPAEVNVGALTVHEP
ncbi:MAG TPA: hypothetical protein VIH33_00790 [Candidatus Limnocylindria bacterium]|jgi:hypothetical protein